MILIKSEGFLSKKKLKGWFKYFLNNLSATSDCKLYSSLFCKYATNERTTFFKKKENNNIKEMSLKSKFFKTKVEKVFTTSIEVDWDSWIRFKKGYNIPRLKNSKITPTKRNKNILYKPLLFFFEIKNFNFLKLELFDFK